MVAEPGDEIAAGTGGRGHLRVLHADREQAIDSLKAAFVRGVLAKDEFSLRVGQTLAARTYAELAAVTADLPARADRRPAAPASPGSGRTARSAAGRGAHGRNRGLCSRVAVGVPSCPQSGPALRSRMRESSWS